MNSGMRATSQILAIRGAHPQPRGDPELCGYTSKFQSRAARLSRIAYGATYCSRRPMCLASCAQIHRGVAMTSAASRVGRKNTCEVDDDDSQFDLFGSSARRRDGCGVRARRLRHRHINAESERRATDADGRGQPVRHERRGGRRDDSVFGDGHERVNHGRNVGGQRRRRRRRHGRDDLCRRALFFARHGAVAGDGDDHRRVGGG